MVAEADESDRSFLKLFPTIAVMTNIDHEHMESYGSFDDLQQAFVDFANKVPFYGAVVACADDAAAARGAAAADAPRDDLRLSTRRDADVTRRPTCALEAFGVALHRAAPRPRGTDGAPTLGALALQVPGRHNLLNALAAVAVGPRARRAVRRGSPPALAEFRGAERRFERARRSRTASLVVDDYGHHPTEIAAVLAAARARSSRRDRRRVPAAPLHADRAAAATSSAPRSRGADEVVLTDIYAAGEEPIPGVTVEALADAVARRRRAARCTSCRALDDVPAAVARARARRRPRASRSAPDRSAASATACCAAIERGAAGTGGGREPVAAPADKRFRRAHVKPARAKRSRSRGVAGRVARRSSAPWRSSCYAGYRGVDAGRRARRALQVDHIVVTRQRAAVDAARCWRCSTGCAARTS